MRENIAFQDQIRSKPKKVEKTAFVPTQTEILGGRLKHASGTILVPSCS